MLVPKSQAKQDNVEVVEIEGATPPPGWVFVKKGAPTATPAGERRQYRRQAMTVIGHSAEGVAHDAAGQPDPLASKEW